MPRTGLIADYYDVLRAGFAAESVRRADPTLQAWAAGARTNPGRSTSDVMSDPHAVSMLTLMLQSMDGAIRNLGAMPE